MLGFAVCLVLLEAGRSPVTNASGELIQAPSSYSQGTPDTSKLTPVPVEALSAELKDTDGSQLRLSEFGGKVLVINLWATWCGPCHRQIPDLVKLAGEYHERDVEVLGLTTDSNDPDIGEVRNFIRDQKVPYRTIYDRTVLAASLQTATNARPVIPLTFIITRDQKILTLFEGYDRRTTPQKMRQYVDLALNSPR